MKLKISSSLALQQKWQNIRCFLKWSKLLHTVFTLNILLTHINNFFVALRWKPHDYSYQANRLPLTFLLFNRIYNCGSQPVCTFVKFNKQFKNLIHNSYPSTMLWSERRTSEYLYLHTVTHVAQQYLSFQKLSTHFTSTVLSHAQAAHSTARFNILFSQLVLLSFPCRS